jgi:hypothetical protein
MACAGALRDALVGDRSDKQKDRKKAFRQLWELTCLILNKTLPLHDDTVLDTLWDSCAKSTRRAQTAAAAVALDDVALGDVVSVPVVAPPFAPHSDDSVAALPAPADIVSSPVPVVHDVAAAWNPWSPELKAQLRGYAKQLCHGQFGKWEKLRQFAIKDSSRRQW